MSQLWILVVVVIVMVAGIWFVQHSMYRNEEKKRLYELKRESQKAISPIRLRAYERLALLLERTTPKHMLMEVNIGEMTIAQLQQHLLGQIRQEFEHNQSQQIYVSDEVWTMIEHARDEMAAFVVGIASRMPAEATALDYAKTLLTAYAENGTTPSEAALERLKDEAKTLM